ncbi:uncharacterized protein LOC135486787 [Lineus longissimus]|uniref:uncharacterized protein LOC135486787 n=1 Tax=Lineus longissimus TaxID=88925 RepID=UPI00315D5D7A
MIGCDHAFQFLENRLVKGDGPTVQYSNLGCFVSGPLFPVKIEHSVITSANRINTTANEHIIEDNDPEIQSLEEFINSSTLQPTDENDTDFDEQFKSDFMQKIEFKDGNYSVPLPWRPDHAELLTNRRECEARLRQVMARLRKLNLLNNYTQVMQENLDKGFISEGSPDDCDTGHYLPHFPVLRDSETTPLRIVFDASSGSPSLNSCLYEGPNMLQDLTELIMLFRTKRIGLSADIARAFLAVHLLESERKWVRFLWYKDNDVSKELIPYHCNTVIFGNVSSPFALAITLHKHLSSYDTPVAKDMKTKFYVDNLLTGVDSNQEALDYFQESREIMNHASFNLRQWSSNSETLDERIRSEGVQTKSDIVGVLGLKWDTKSDQISVAKKDLKSSGELSKRKVTSQTASIFDPLGIVAPLTVPAKSYVNNLWRGQKTWDEHLSITERQEWETIKQESLSLTHMLSIPRWLGGDTSKPLQIVVFCDACPTTAIGCVAYAKQNNKVALIGSKNKVISEKNVNFTVPKLELMAMVLGVNYAETLRNTYITQYQTIEVVYSTDSEIALYWLRSNKKLKQFVHNRVQTIRQKSDLTSWYHVSTKQNAADILSRGATHQELKDSSWLQGPKWLKDDKTTWPLTALSDLTLNSSVSLTAAFEMQNDFVVTSMVATTPVASISDVIAQDKFSSWNRLLRITALVSRAFKPGLKNRNKLSAQDIANAGKKWITNLQNEHYKHVTDYLKLEQSGRHKLPSRPTIISQLGLVLDKKGTIRCGGRLTNSDVSSDRKYPILLPNQSYITTLIVRNAHHNVVHYGLGSTMAYLREKYWVTSMRSTVKKIIGHCVICKKVSGRPYLTPIAPPLPDFRINDLSAFKSTAVDFTSHLYVRIKDSIQKVYVCLFTCCTTRGIHLEITPDLTVESFLRAFRRFTSTHSVPSLIYCDNAKTFTSADTELKRLYNIVGTEQFQNHLSKKGITFKYAPVQASWFAGVHERLIGVTKLALKKTLRKSLVPIDEFQTLIKEIQATVNNRPLTYLSSDPNELKAITPNNLIYGHDMSLLPHEGEDNLDVTYAGRDKLEKLAYKRAERLQTFKKRFYDEYLARLREQHQYELSKQNAKADIIKIDDVILVHDKDAKRRHWKLGIIKELNRGQDGLTRSALVKTATGQSNRAIGKLYPLELTVDESIERSAQIKSVQKTKSRPKRSTTDITRLKIREHLDYYGQ